MITKKTSEYEALVQKWQSIKKLTIISNDILVLNLLLYIQTYQLLNSDDHANFLRKNKKNPADYRPDITHQALLTILDSPVNKAGRLQAVYVRTEKGVLFEIKPHVRIPRTYKRFSGIMLQLLQKLSITAVGKREKLLRVIKNPVTQYLPVNSRKIGFSHSSEKLVNMNKYIAATGGDTDLVFVIGAMAHGKIETDYTEDFLAISGYPLSAAYCISRICEALAENWDIL
ncbi:ribosomal RNA small subunit methyltransferase NEP1-like [Carica papaya]|uniref:ribosomal RNA small subunit methyltransferase NEP1-like n=1 Tax=Carica papaya TaxID=3649 RepID=UPI000B8D1A60|nr:ribosomal RNA small subunit methyltransferase NEP1-like [Carica papaya]